MNVAAPSPTLSTFYRGWGRYQRSLVEMLSPLTEEQLALPAASHHWTIGMLAQHVIANRVWWFQMWMGEGGPELADIAHWDPADEAWSPPSSLAELMTGLNQTWLLVEQCLDRWTAADLDQTFPPPSVLREDEREHYPSFTREWIIWHVFEHEIHHGGELSLVLGVNGLPGIYGSM